MVVEREGTNMEQVTCPNCNVDVDPEELKRNNLRCPTCGFDLSDAGDAESVVADEELDDEEDEEDKEDDEEDDDDEDEDE
jgi:Zn-finger nucleic acid-binding protein